MTIPHFLDRPLFRNIAVILGDPKLGDAVKPGGVFAQKEFEELAILKQTLAGMTGYRFTYLDCHETLIDDLKNGGFDFALNFCDNGYRNDPLMEMHVPACLEMLDIPYSGAGPHCLSLSYNKMLVCTLARAAGIPVPHEMLFTDAWDELERWTAFPAMVKPNASDNSFGITSRSVVHNPSELKAQVAWLVHEQGVGQVLIQEFLSGTEYAVTLIGNPGHGFTYLPVYQWDFSGLAAGMAPIQTQAMKYDTSSADYELTQSHHAALDAETEAKLHAYSELLFNCMGGRDYAKIDFRCAADGTLKLIEFNPNPSWDKDALITIEDERKGYFYTDVLRLILESAQLRYAPRLNARQKKMA